MSATWERDGRWFAALPAFDGMSEGSSCVWFTDLRFLALGAGFLAWGRLPAR